jgi:hypothetical protein
MKCPTPEKRAYWSKKAAIRALRTATRSRWSIRRIYPCECGAWHLTSKAKGNY